MTTSPTAISLFGNHMEQQQSVWATALQAEQFDAAVIHSGSQRYSFLDDYHYPFRPNPHFLAWLPLTHHDESVLIIRPGQRPVLYYFQPDDYWYSPPADPESWWSEYFDVRRVRETGQWRSAIPEGRIAYVGDAPALSDEIELNPARLLNRLHLARTVKTAYELACLREAVGIAARAHVAAAEAFREGQSEFAIHQAYLQAAQQEDADLPYGSIVALNEHGAVLHYQQHERSVPGVHRSFLIDAGASCHGYCSDITRTYSATPGHFADLIVAMDRLQLDLCHAMRAGADYKALHLQAHAAIAQLLVDAELIHCSAEQALSNGLTSVFFPHGLGHYLGLQTHDVAGLLANADGTEIARPDGHPFLRLTRVLEAGNVVTVEPGLYFIDSLLERWRAGPDAKLIHWAAIEELRPYGGIRIEDDVVVTTGQPENMSRDAFAAL
ncbi:MAG: Xaa-Pro dipeptidase [Xanthomonadales bacterium]|nr:Xaa-Pro dipeptidase [Xanthomonadales bacterium]